ncbi:LysM peptidoglycan-binding domain-containing protein [Arthrobacter sulfonylureivorans]|uniref:LysM peptidoglycan-binding domain-containing protein n=1 Tax=Arthrobacter sulfonylureivorans TaxID=2486855 RepID=A0ABY3W9N1_9MICC|nr:LysM domain-containing protein [Arthrobacter sulfonylureivorans]UNK47064.1 LysM peptidoglycan-binding domain-containing protein [Arthrobacter sulfonylureivorans]
MRRIISDLVTAGLILGSGAVLILAGTRIGSGSLWPPHNYQDALAVLSIGAGAVVLCWLLLGLAAAAAGAMLAKTGHLRLAALSAAASPAFLLRLAGAVVGLNLMVVPVAHGSPAAATAGLPTSTGPTDTVGIDPLWQPAYPAGEVVDPSWQPTPPAAAPGIVAKPLTRHDLGSPRSVTVTAGDSLWHLAAAELGPLATDAEIAERWPDWHAANRRTIGPDPSLIRPGQTLVVPPPR